MEPFSLWNLLIISRICTWRNAFISHGELGRVRCSSTESAHYDTTRDAIKGVREQIFHTNSLPFQ